MQQIDLTPQNDPNEVALLLKMDQIVPLGGIDDPTLGQDLLFNYFLAQIRKKRGFFQNLYQLLHSRTPSRSFHESYHILAKNVVA